MIDPSQTAFVPCRSLMDNILLSQELLRNSHRESPCPRCAIKVDFQKAYDSNNWNFILDTLHCFHFPSNVIQWIRTCITTPSFSISINGELNGFFRGAKGLRQAAASDCPPTCLSLVWMC